MCEAFYERHVSGNSTGLHNVGRSAVGEALGHARPEFR